ncbi:MAG: hypothetical protein U5L10_01160 [Candidatus Moranbacteria bacterium]|nr:hypothetical protein [Candidatus Moranbacteria bacterium]
MITLLFIITKFFNVLSVSWLWFIFTIIADLYFFLKKDSEIEQGFADGFKEGQKSQKDEEYSDYF